MAIRPRGSATTDATSRPSTTSVYVAPAVKPASGELHLLIGRHLGGELDLRFAHDLTAGRGSQSSLALDVVVLFLHEHERAAQHDLPCGVADFCRRRIPEVGALNRLLSVEASHDVTGDGDHRDDDDRAGRPFARSTWTLLIGSHHRYDNEPEHNINTPTAPYPKAGR